MFHSNSLETSISHSRWTEPPDRRKETEDLNNINQRDLTGIYRTLHPTTTDTFLSSALGTFSGTDHMLAHKLSLNRFKNRNHTKYLLQLHNGMKLEASNRRKTGTFPNLWKLKSRIGKQRKTNETESWFFRSIIKSDKTLARRTKGRKKIQILKLRNKSGDITTESIETKKVYINSL